jgi:hypothetical protein
VTHCDPRRMEGMTMTHTRRDFIKTATATAVLTATLPAQAKETPTMSSTNFADVNGQHIFYSVHGAGKPLILLHGASTQTTSAAIWPNWPRAGR